MAVAACFGRSQEPLCRAPTGTPGGNPVPGADNSSPLLSSPRVTSASKHAHCLTVALPVVVNDWRCHEALPANAEIALNVADTQRLETGSGIRPIPTSASGASQASMVGEQILTALVILRYRPYQRKELLSTAGRWIATIGGIS